jgi:dihydropteroate synthase
MEYHAAVNRLEGLRRLRPKLGTEATAAMLAHLDDPHEGVPAVQVAGSNGKGSTARLLASMLDEAGMTVGLYTSPDLNGLRERIQVGTSAIPKADVTTFVERLDPSLVDRAAEGETPTFFEVLTVLALWHFGRADVDVAVLEVGIGGRYDATSVVDPEAAAVTSISLEHTEIIGATVEEIAADKASVAPADAPLVTGATGPALETIRETTDVVTVGAAATNGGVSASNGESDRPASPDVRAIETGTVTGTESAIELVGPDWAVETESPLLGAHQAVNAGIAATLARQVADPTEAEIAAGIRTVHWPGRFEVMGTDPLVVLDGAHNPAACETVTALLERFDYDDLHLVIGAMREKDHGEMVRALPTIDRASVAAPTVERAQDAATLAAIVERESDAAVREADAVAGALERGLAASAPADCVLVTGSLYTVSEARDRWTRHPSEVRRVVQSRAEDVLAGADVPPEQRAAVRENAGARTVRLHARRHVATDLRTRLLARGGTGAVSGIRVTDRHVPVVLSGSTAQFRDLVRSLRDEGGDRAPLARQLATALGLGDARAVADESDRTAIMGILNVTPDSFYDGGEYVDPADAIERAREMVAAGAAVVDVGGESTRPGADPVTAATERERVVPVVEALSDLDATVSVDTRKPAVAAAAVDAGAEMVNDVTGLADAAMRRVVADAGVEAVLMHSLSAPVEPDRSWHTDAVVEDVFEALTERVLLAERAGIDRSQLVVDPGLGFGKGPRGSFALLDRLDEFHALGTRVMVGHSQKSMLAPAAGPADGRSAPTVAATALAAERGADLVRVHDVAANVAAVATARHTVEED